MDTPAKSTVRMRKKNPKAATQRFLPIAEIRNDTVMLKNGGMRAVIAVEALNFNLKSDTEQAGIIAGYGQFVNTLTFPLQIVMRSTKTNIDDYLQQLRSLAVTQKNPLLQNQITTYVQFIEQLLDLGDIMQKRFFVVVPVDRATRKKTMLEQFFDWLHPEDTAAKSATRNREFAQFSKQLNERVDLVMAGLGNIGLHTHRMNTKELLELYYQVYNPKVSQHEKIPADLEQLQLDKTVM